MNIRKPLTFETLFQYVSDYDIFRYYCIGFYEIGRKFPSPFRKDKQPSAVIYSTNIGRLRFNDFVLPTMSSIEFVSHLYSISLIEALYKIAIDFKIKEVFVTDWGGDKPSPSGTPILYHKKITKATETIIQVKYRAWSGEDLSYWRQYGIGIDTLSLFHVLPIEYFWLNDARFKAAKYAYTYNYYWDKGIYRRKIYQPYSRTAKWYSNGGLTVQGHGVLPKSGKLLIITKALKDVMSLYELGYVAIAPASETSLPNSAYMTKQLKRFDKVVLFLDNDETGKEMSIKHSTSYNIPYILIPDSEGVKDISDYIKAKGIDSAKELMNKLLNSLE